MAKSWTMYVIVRTTASDDIERKLRLHNTTNKRRRHGHESQTSTGGRVRGRKADYECSKTWRLRPDGPMKRVVCRETFNEPAGADRRRSTAFADPASRVFTTRFQEERPSSARTLSTAGRAVTVQAMDLDMCSFESARRRTGIFCLVAVAQRFKV